MYACIEYINLYTSSGYIRDGIHDIALKILCLFELSNNYFKNKKAEVPSPVC